VRKAFIVSIVLSCILLLYAFTASPVNATAMGIAPYDDNVPQDSLLADTTAHSDTTVAVKDTVKPYQISDSTYIEQLTYKREDAPVTEVFATVNPFYLKAPPAVQREVKLDSTGKFVIVRETISGKDIKMPMKIPLEEYVRQRSQSDFDQNFRDMVTKEAAGKKKKNDLGELLGSFTNIDIPVPANPVFSIFGPPRINLVISGGVDIRAAFRNTKTDQATTSIQGNSRNEPDFAQEVQINVNGTIGDKLNILADWNTQRTFEYENQLKIKYTGYEDEIVQSVEAGNVSLTTNSSFVSNSSALFGVKAGFQLGPLRLTAIASQKKGQIQEKSITGGSTTTEFAIHAYDYSRNHFFIDTLYEPYYEAYLRDRSYFGPGQVLTNEYEVWITDKSQTEVENQWQANAVFGLRPLDTAYYNQIRSIDKPEGDTIVGGTWKKLQEGKDYEIDRYAGYISFSSQIEGEAVAIAYKIAGAGTGNEVVYGNLTKDEQSTAKRKLVLKLIKPRSFLPKDTLIWNLMLKNIYSLGATKIDKTSFELNINYEEPGKVPVTVLGSQKTLRIFGFDEFNDAGVKQENGDTKFDYREGITIDSERGWLIFPTRFPFDKDLEKALKKYEFPDTTFNYYRYDSLYNMLPTDAAKNTLKDRFMIRGKTIAGSSNTIPLGFNVVEGSVQVLLDGQPLTQNVDYTVDYIIGQVTIKNQAALVPGAKLQVKYEQNNLFQLASKTLLGTRGEVKLSDKTQFGFTMMNLNEQTLSDKIRLGEEPRNNSIYGIDGQTAGEVPFLTKALDVLPFLDTKTKSEFTLRGEVAYMSPDPNTKKSPIPDDKGAGIAYLDDFEGAKRLIPLGVNYGTWRDMSAPYYQFNVDRMGVKGVKDSIIADTEKMWSKARTYWYNQTVPATVKEIYGVDEYGNPIKKVGRNNQVATLTVNYNPKLRGKYNYSMNLRQTLLANPQKNWGGIQRAISLTPVNLRQENVNFIEIWVNFQKGNLDSTKKIFIDLGAISEDVIPGGYNTEDKLPVRNGILNEGEDTGIDNLTDDEEREKYKDFIEANRPYNDSIPDPTSDPSGDDWNYSDSRDYTRINGEEGNRKSEIGRFPDTEDLNRNNTTDFVNNYYEFELPLDTTSNNPYRVGGGYRSSLAPNGWYQFRIPLTNFKNKIGSPDLSSIEYVRLWFTNHDEEFEIRIAEFNLIGNQWEELKRNDSTFKVSVVNIEDNYIQGYRSPGGVIREKDRTKPDEDVLGNEQSLALNFFNLKAGESREAIKRYTYKALDIFSYRQMKLFVHGDDFFAGTADKPTAKVFIRFGSDSLNYYEYRAPVYPGWDRNNIKIIFEDLTSLKQVRKSAAARFVLPVPGGPDSATYAVLGNPSLTKISYISIGVENPGTSSEPITGQIWVNELRLIEVDNTPGWAYSVSTNVRLADLGSVAFTYSQTDPFFHVLESSFGSRITSTNWNLSTSFALEKFFPKEWAGTSFPFSYSHSENIQTPRYLPSSDIVVEKAAELRKREVIKETGSEELGEQQRKQILAEAQTLSITETYALPTFRVNFPTDYWLVRDFFNKLTYGFNYTTSTQRTPTIFLQTSWQWNARLGYAYTLSPNNYLQPFGFFNGVFLFEEFKDLQLYYLPITNITTDVTMVRSRTNQRFREQTSPINPTRSLNSTRNMAFGWKLTENGLLNLSGDYSLAITSTLSHLEIDQFGKQRSFQEILERIIMQDRLISFGIDNSYIQSFNVNSKPRVPPIFKLDKYFTLTARYGVSYQWRPALETPELGSSTSWANNISLSTDISLKSFVETWFPARSASTQSATQPSVTPRGRRGGNDEDEGEESSGEKPKNQQPQPADTTSQGTKKPGEGLIGVARLLFKTPFLDYDKINVSFTQTNSSQNNGVLGRPGFSNFFGRMPFVQTSDDKYGPSRAYQLGLVTTPTANITDVFLKPQFPFIGFATDAYKQERTRKPGVIIADVFTQNNKLTLRTSRDLWTGARIDLNWNLGWDYSRTQNPKFDSTSGRFFVEKTGTSGAIERSFFTVPPAFIFSVFKSGIKEVGKKYGVLAGNQSDTRKPDAKLSQAFEEGFESLPLLKKLFGQYLPRSNYSFRWDGLEQLGMFKNFATRVSLDHAYQSSYRQSYISDINGIQTIQAQKITYGFSPLAGISITFKELLKGNMSANFRYGSNVSYDLTPASKAIVENVTNEMSLTASYGRTGFEIPLFGLALQNDIDISVTYSYSKNTRSTYDAKDEQLAETPGEGSSRTQIEPRIRYVLSSRVTASLFYRYTKIAPDKGGSRVPGQTTNEGGLDVRISIQ